MLESALSIVKSHEIITFMSVTKDGVCNFLCPLPSEFDLQKNLLLHHSKITKMFSLRIQKPKKSSQSSNTLSLLFHLLTPTDSLVVSRWKSNYE